MSTRLVSIDSKGPSVLSLPGVTSLEIVGARVSPDAPFTDDLYVSIGPSGPLVSPSGFNAHALMTYTVFENRYKLSVTVPQHGTWPLIKSFDVTVQDRDGNAVLCHYTILVKVTF